jgi:hypothetical protein
MIVYEENGKILGTANNRLEEKYIGSVLVNPDYHKMVQRNSINESNRNNARETLYKKKFLCSISLKCSEI